ncbi:MAG: tRNA (adenosine(37)-N6)-dimethylallyltransferase MiaA [Gemmataceae bacterium]
MPPPPSAFADALVLTGPTGSGKSAVALEVAEQIGGEIVAMDSMTLYRGMDIGTAKPSAADRARVPHHLLDLLDPSESANVAWWLDRAAAACADIRGRGKRPLLVGGTPFYLKAVLCGLSDAPPADPAVRGELEAEAGRIGPAALHARLAAVDPPSAARLHPNDVRRVVRALEVFTLTGRPLSSFHETWDSPSFLAPDRPVPPPARISCLWLDWPRESLYRRINTRVGEMIAAGWVDEVRSLLQRSRLIGREASQAIGYKELAAHLSGSGPGWAETVESIKTRTRQFAKRQLTWFRGLAGCEPCPAAAPGLAGRALSFWTASRSAGEN